MRSIYVSPKGTVGMKIPLFVSLFIIAVLSFSCSLFNGPAAPGGQDTVTEVNFDKCLQISVNPGGMGGNYSIQPVEFAVTSVNITVTYVTTNAEVANLTWSAGDGVKTYPIHTARMGVYKIRVIHTGANNGQTMQVEESATVDVEPMRLVAVNVVPGGTLQVGVDPSFSYNFYYGSFHNHTEYSDGKGADPAAAFAYARDVAGLDWLGMTDHGESFWYGTKWEDTLAQADAATEDGVFVAMRGFEWTSMDYGHVCVLGTDEYCASWNPATNTLDELVSWLNERDCVATFNHPGRFDANGTENSHFWTAPSDRFIAVELFGDNGFFDEYYYNDGYYRNDGNKGYLDEALSRGWKTGAGGGFDEHEGTWGTASEYRLCVLAPSLTRANLMDGLKSRRFFATADRNLGLYFEINGNVMGSTVSSGSCTAKIRAFDGDGEGFSQVVLIKNGAVAKTWNISAAAPEISYSFTASSADYYYCRVRQADGDEAISSSIWIAGGNGDTEAPSAPSDLASPSQTSSSIDLAWTASTDNAGVSGYKIYRDGSQIGESTVPAYTDNGLAENTTYSYTVAAYDAALNVSGPSEAVSAATLIEGVGLLAGSTTDSGSDHCGGDISLSKYKAAADGTANEIRIKLASAAGGTVKCAIYSDNAGVPDRLLGSTNERAAPAAGWQTFTLTAPVCISRDACYWIVAWSDNTGFTLKCSSDSGNGRYKRITYGAWPDPMASELLINNVKYCMYVK